MTLDEIRQTFRSYHTASARIAFLQDEAEELRRGIELENRPELHAIHAQSYNAPPSGQPFGGSVTERVVLFSADGKQDQNAVRWSRELQQIETEIRHLQRVPRLVEIWLSGLNEKERTVITAHEIDRESWEEMATHSTKLLGMYYSVSGLRKIGKTAMQKVANIAR